MYSITEKIIQAYTIWNDCSSGISYSRSEIIQYSQQIVRNIKSRSNNCHFQITTGFRSTDGIRKWFIHSKLHAFISNDRKEIAFWAEPNVNAEDEVNEMVLRTCVMIMKQWRVSGLLVATDIPDIIREWQEGCDGPHYCFTKEDK